MILFPSIILKIFFHWCTGDKSSNGCIEKGNSNGWGNSEIKEDGSLGRLKHNSNLQNVSDYNNRPIKQPKYDLVFYLFIYFTLI